MSEWINKKVKELCHIGRGRVINQEEIFEKTGVYPVYSSQSMNKGEMGRIDTYDFEGEYVTWTTDGAYAGTVFHRTGKFNCTNVCGTLKAKNDDELDLLFLSYLLATESKKHVSYVGNPKLMNGIMGEIDLKLPKEKPEQTRIAQILSKADAAIEQTEKLIAKYQRIKTGLMQDLLTKGIDEHGNIRNEKTHRFKTEIGLRVPVEWSVRELGTLCEMKGRIGWQGYTINDLTDDASEPTVIGGTQISKEHCLDFSKPVYLKRQKYLEAPEIFVKQGNIVLVKTGNTIGKTALVDYEIGDATINPNTVILRDFNGITNRFLYLIMISDYFQKALWDFVFVGAQPSVNQTNMKTIKIPLPKDTEQLKISGAFFSLTNQIEAERTKLSKLHSLKTGLMQDLLSGKVRVKMSEPLIATD
jgi:type I restriction enzyme S subunit